MDDYSDKKFEVQKKMLLMLIAVLAFLIFAYLSGTVSWITDTLLFVQLISAIFSMFIGLLALVRFYTKKSKLSFLVVGVGFILISFLEGFQLVSSVSSFKSLFSYSSTELFPLSMVLSMSFLAVIFFLSFLVRKEREKGGEKKEKVVYISIVSSFVLMFGIFTLFTNIFSSYHEYVPALIGGILSMLMFVLSILGYWRANTWRYGSFEYWQLFSLIFLLISTIFFLPFLNLEHDLAMKFSVFARFFSYIAMLVGFLVSIYELYDREQDYLRELKEKNELLLKTKGSVEEAYMMLRNEKWDMMREKKGKIDSILQDVINSRK